jgi:hypothetical protein
MMHAAVLSVSNEVYQGGKLDLMKIVTPQFQLSHSLAFGSSVAPATYDLSATYATQKVHLRSKRALASSTPVRHCCVCCRSSWHRA